MVVPMEKASSGKPKKIVGNNQNVNIEENHASIKLIGNQCTLNVLRNNGCIKIVGDGCRVVMANGTGSISYIGNKGVLEIGENVQESKIDYIGNSGKVVKMVDGQRQEKSLSMKTKFKKSSSVGCLDLANKKSIHIENCEKVYIPYYELNISLPCLKTYAQK